MKSKRLKLYDDSLELVINNKTKKLLRKVAFSKKMTMSEYVRNLIILDLLKYDQNKLSNDLAHTTNMIVLKTIRGLFRV